MQSHSGGLSRQKAKPLGGLNGDLFKHVMRLPSWALVLGIRRLKEPFLGGCCAQLWLLKWSHWRQPHRRMVVMSLGTHLHGQNHGVFFFVQGLLLMKKVALKLRTTQKVDTYLLLPLDWAELAASWWEIGVMTVAVCKCIFLPPPLDSVRMSLWNGKQISSAYHFLSLTPEAEIHSLTVGMKGKRWAHWSLEWHSSFSDFPVRMAWRGFRTLGKKPLSLSYSGT